MRHLILCATVVLAGCNTMQPNVVTEVVKPPLPYIAPVKAPPQESLPVFQFQQPSNPTSIIALDAANYGKLRSTLNHLNKREMLWQNRLDQANDSIWLLQEVQQDASSTPAR